jgi:hypothetical protein
MLHRNGMRRGRSEDGISEVVGFVVILAIVVASLSLYLTYALPVLGREDEIKEMDSVRAWFVDYKTGTDQLWLHSPLVPGDVSGSDEGPELFNSTIGQVTLRRVINAGTLREKGFVERYFPLLAPIPSSAEVSVKSGGSPDSETLVIWARDGGGNEYSASINGTALGYTSHNYYWFQQQYYYQLGGVFLRQWDQKGGADAENVSVISSPPLSIYSDLNATQVELVAVNLRADAGGFGATSPIRVETRLDSDPIRPTGPTGATWPTAFSEASLTFRGASPQAAEEWRAFFVGAAVRNGLAQGRYTDHLSGNTAWINITGSSTLATDNDVMLEVLLANYTMSMENVPTLIE